MVDQLIFWYRAATASADTAVLTARTALSRAFGRGGGGCRGAPVVEASVLTGVTQEGSRNAPVVVRIQGCGPSPRQVRGAWWVRAEEGHTRVWTCGDPMLPRKTPT